jgi:hypothetical protein
MPQAKVFAFNPGNMRVLVVKFFFIMKGAYEVLNVKDLRVTVANKFTYVFLFVYKGGLSFIFGSCDMLRGDSTYAVEVTSGHGRVIINVDIIPLTFSLNT